MALATPMSDKATAPISETEKKQPADACRSHQECRKLEARGFQYFKSKEYEQALADYRAAYALVPVPRLLLAMGRCFHYMERYDEALEQYRRYKQENEEANKALLYEAEALQGRRGSRREAASKLAAQAGGSGRSGQPLLLGPGQTATLPQVQVIVNSAAPLERPTEPPAPPAMPPPSVPVSAPTWGGVPVASAPAAVPLPAPAAANPTAPRGSRPGWAVLWTGVGVVIGGAISGGIAVAVLGKQRQDALSSATEVR